jgi:tRNA (cmo5U34)-methyltransferase
MKMETSNVYEFSFTTIRDFDSHIAQEIRGYETLFTIATGIANTVIATGTNIYDLGCSTGRFLITLAERIAAEADTYRRRYVRFIGIEPNDNFAAYHTNKPDSVTFVRERITASTQFENASLISSIFTLQFIPIHERQAVIRNVYHGLNPGGVLLLAEKVYAGDPEIERLINDSHFDFKREFTDPAQIFAKDVRLRSIMRPLTLQDNVSLLENAGFDRHECFWRVNNFAALIAIKGGAANASGT